MFILCLSLYIQKIIYNPNLKNINSVEKINNSIKRCNDFTH
ncbi:hypothetical protein JJD26997_1635 [Campylobacter jejuni subsp. doylei 269.97]|uniref:Uncharacterized protein n=1 Tax=Campylobacter jejuni subsp. doylei (strain ATCC BAA-1458 / RM4099 / 269.97) TaxID=360109 RepID=A7H545_CAMJD|nr:hypothetical protein JJD26997_1635 [Campylobacter jejuni subsp. doylei 269.97]